MTNTYKISTVLMKMDDQGNLAEIKNPTPEQVAVKDMLGPAVHDVAGAEVVDERRLGVADVALAGEEDEDVAGAGGHELVNGVEDAGDLVTVLVLWELIGYNGVLIAFLILEYSFPLSVLF